MTKRRWLAITALILGALVVTAGVVVARGPAAPSRAPLAQSAVGTGFTYQGRLDEGGNPADGAFDLKFTLFDADVGGAQVGGIVSLEDTAVVSGLFTVRLDFGDGAFTGDARWLEVAPDDQQHRHESDDQKLSEGNLRHDQRLLQSEAASGY